MSAIARRWAEFGFTACRGQFYTEAKAKTKEEDNVTHIWEQTYYGTQTFPAQYAAIPSHPSGLRGFRDLETDGHAAPAEPHAAGLRRG